MAIVTHVTVLFKWWISVFLHIIGIVAVIVLLRIVIRLGCILGF